MTEAEITAAHNTVLDALPLLASLFGSNIGIVFTVAGVLAITGFFVYLITSLMSFVWFARRGS